MRYPLLIATFIAATMLSACAQQGDEPQNYRLGEFRFFYTLSGPDALPAENQVDADNNGVPDFVENIAVRLQSSWQIMTESFGMTSPLESERYRGKVDFIAVEFHTRDGSGSAGDAIMASREFPGKHALKIRLSNRLRPDTLTPTHELFHVFQNGYTMFKTRWYTEGTARWSEYILKEGTGSREDLPPTTEALLEVLQQTYDTKTMWRRLAYLLDTNDGSFEVPINLPPPAPGYDEVLEDTRIYGYEFMRFFLEELDRLDALAATIYGVAEHDWEEDLQKSERNTPYILCAIKFTVERFSIPDKRRDEFDAYLGAIDEITGDFCQRLSAG